MSSDPEILSGRFETLPARSGPGWAMRVTAEVRNVHFRAFPFVARVGAQKVDALRLNLKGDTLHGYLRQMPAPGDRLFVGFLEANQSTPVVYQPQVSGTLVASQSEDDLGIIGDDDRMRITPTTAAPWKWICQIEPSAFSSNRLEESGSGLLISDRHVLTAAHVVWEAFKNAQQHVITVRPGFDYDKEPFDSSTAARVYVCPKYTGEEDQEEFDYALITLHQPLGQKKLGQQILGFWGSADYGTQFAFGPLDQKTFPHAFTAGYPGNKGGRQLWSASGYLATMGENLMRTTADTTRGQSGSPVWVTVGDRQVLVGIAVAATRANNVVRRITGGMLLELATWMKRDGDTAVLSLPRQAAVVRAMENASIEQAAPSATTPAAPQTASASTATAAAALIRSDGIDVYTGSTLPSWADLQTAGVAFLIHKCSEGGGITDRSFQARYRDTRANRMIRGCYHYYRHTDGQSGAVQADQVVLAVTRLRPGDLAPSLDFENSALVAHQHEPATAADWRTELIQFLDTVETTLGRVPMIYTSTSAWQHLSGKHDYVAANFTEFGEYPLWVKSYRPRVISVPDTSKNPPLPVKVDLDNPPHPMTALYKSVAARAGEVRYTGQRLTNKPLAANIPGPWQGKWALWQYSPFTPSSLFANGFRDWLLDFDVTNGGIYYLRGLADLGRTAPHRSATLSFVAFANADGGLHLFEYVNNAWIEDHRLANANVPAAGGDPGAVCLRNEQFVIYRAANDHIIALQRLLSDTGNAPWMMVDISNGVAVDDPSVFIFQNQVHVVFGDEANRHVHVTRTTTGGWQSELWSDRANARPVSGSAAPYVHNGELHLVSRAGSDGHLLDFCLRQPSTAPVDLTASAHGTNVPAATYRPNCYTPAGHATRIVYRGLGGNIWQIERDTLIAMDLTAASGAPAAFGNPSTVAAGETHILFRNIDGLIQEIYEEAGVWRTRHVAPESAADPTAFVNDQGNAAVSFRAVNGTIRVANYSNAAWTVEDLG